MFNIIQTLVGAAGAQLSKGEALFKKLGTSATVSFWSRESSLSVWVASSVVVENKAYPSLGFDWAVQYYLESG